MSTSLSRATAPRLLQGPRLLARAGVAHGFTTRMGGCSTGPRFSLNLARREGGSDACLVENWRRTLAAMGGKLALERVAILEQVHGASVLGIAQGAGPLKVVGVGDAAVTSAAGVVLAVRVADCVPILLSAPGAVAVAHAGWRGTVAGVVGAVVQSLCEVSQCAPDKVIAAIGPHISGAAYEVGPEVVGGLRQTGLEDEVFLRRGPFRDHVDLGAAAQALLQRAGVSEIDRIPGCTYSDPRFYSHRREGPSTGRLAGLVALCC